MTNLEHIGPLITETLAAIKDNTLWVNDENCTREQVTDLLIECKTDLLIIEKNLEDEINRDKTN